ncbi:lactosylceramide 4-alpha-glycosyltransferase [Sesbania bispinosa]|nr:lactosylceramide 4-alpha-glycosyltransferase [Sesbania bispinosa]
MLRNLRSQRRPRYGGFLCGIVSALLLLLSLSLLHSHSHRRFPSHVVNYDSLLSDSANDDATGGEDTIDALDVEEEQPQDATDVEEDDEPLDEKKVSGYFFYHVEGVIKRAFSKRSMMEEWDDEFGIFPTAEEDRGKTAFGSDDVAVDERVRLKAIQVKGIEDALLLKVGRKVSPLREGWGDWFDKKGDFLRKDKMLRSNLEALNPLHNPILQDPDGVGLTGLTKADKLLHKSFLNELKKLPIPARKMTRES